MQSEDLITIIDSLAPINNAFRREKNAIKRIEYMWELGSLLDQFIQKNKLTLDELLYSVYDPHATIKRSNITRSLGSYSYRIRHFFKNKKDIHKILPKLKSYNVFIEALPLLMNKKYTSHVNSKNILSIVNSQESSRRIVDRLNLIKQSILPTRKLRVSPGNMYVEEKQLLQSIIRYVGGLYITFNSISELNNLKFNLYNIKYREQLISILMAVASDAFISKIKIYSENEISGDLRNLYKIAVSNNENRARFRKWVLSSTRLLWLAEAIHALSNDNDFRYFKKKLAK